METKIEGWRNDDRQQTAPADPPKHWTAVRGPLGLLGALALPVIWRLAATHIVGFISIFLAIWLWHISRALDPAGGMFRRWPYLLAVVLEIVAIYTVRRATAVWPSDLLHRSRRRERWFALRSSELKVAAARLNHKH